jgi:phytoene synthase
MRDRELVRLHWPVELRPAFDALFGIDDAMAEVVASASQPALAAIKLAWWREALERLDTSPPPAEPRLQAVATELLPRGVSGAELAGIEEGWAALLEPAVEQERVGLRGERLFAAGARLLGGGAPAGAGQLWSAVDLARRLGRPLPRPEVLPKSPRELRPLTMLSALAVRDAARGQPLESEATPARSWTILRHRLTGR